MFPSIYDSNGNVQSTGMGLPAAAPGNWGGQPQPQFQPAFSNMQNFNQAMAAAAAMQQAPVASNEAMKAVAQQMVLSQQVSALAQRVQFHNQQAQQMGAVRNLF